MKSKNSIKKYVKMISDPFFNPDEDDTRKYLIPEFTHFNYEANVSVTDLILLSFEELDQVLDVNYHFLILYALGWLFYEKEDFAQSFFDELDFDDPSFEIECNKKALSYFEQSAYQGYQKALEMKEIVRNELNRR